MIPAKKARIESCVETLISNNNLPFTFAELGDFKALLKVNFYSFFFYIIILCLTYNTICVQELHNTSYDPPCVETIRNTLVPAKHDLISGAVLKSLEQIDACTVILDLWSSINMAGYLWISCTATTSLSLVYLLART